jgi:hypothetical protein
MTDHYEAPDSMTREVFNQPALGLVRLASVPRLTRARGQWPQDRKTRHARGTSWTSKGRSTCIAPRAD